MLILNTFLILLLLLTLPWSNTRFSYGETDSELAGSELSLTLAIPCVSRHIRFLGGLFADVSSQTLMPVEVQYYALDCVRILGYQCIFRVGEFELQRAVCRLRLELEKHCNQHLHDGAHVRWSWPYQKLRQMRRPQFEGLSTMLLRPHRRRAGSAPQV